MLAGHSSPIKGAENAVEGFVPSFSVGGWVVACDSGSNCASRVRDPAWDAWKGFVPAFSGRDEFVVLSVIGSNCAEMWCGGAEAERSGPAGWVVA